jgi:hypothetical protein
MSELPKKRVRTSLKAIAQFKRACILSSSLSERCNHEVPIYIEHHSICPLVEIGTSPTPLPQASVPLPLDQKVGGTLACGWGGGGVPIPTTGEKA